MAASPPADAAMATKSKAVPTKGNRRSLLVRHILPGLYLPYIISTLIGVSKGEKVPLDNIKIP